MVTFPGRTLGFLSPSCLSKKGHCLSRKGKKALINLLSADCGGTLVLVSQDGIQRPPLHFPPGGHLLAFLSCLETGLLPRGQLEPPLWSQKGKVCFCRRLSLVDCRLAC